MEKQPLIRITKRFQFEAAHALWNYDGPCRNIHGHSYVLYVTIAGYPNTDPDDPKCGMVMDFSQVKKIVNKEVIELFDHALMVNAGTPHNEIIQSGEVFGKVIALPYQPTCENMVVDFSRRLRDSLPAHVQLFSLRLHETDTAFAEWLASDNN